LTRLDPPASIYGGNHSNATFVFQPSPGSSPRKFANQGLVYLTEIESVSELQELSVKQMKDLLAMNRVNFKGVVEKEELLKIVERVWRQHMKAGEGKERKYRFLK
jgi:hypothetical protein